MSVTCTQGDALTVLRTFPDEQFHCCVTSPPYWGLRDYGTARWEGGAPNCEHSGVARKRDREGSNGEPGPVRSDRISRNCLKCGATRIDTQIGLESTVEEYVARMVEVFNEVRRVLRRDGTLWLNLGDSYSNAGTRQGDRDGAIREDLNSHRIVNGGYRRRVEGLKNKDLVGIPWRVAFALQADGYYLRSDIIWAKPNPMPESVTDRPTKSHEYLFLLAKSERYYYDAEAISEAAATADPFDPSFRVNGKSTGRNRLEIPGQKPHGLYFAVQGDPDGRRNKRSVWTIQMQPYPEAHFATFPEDLVRPCILAGCPHGGTVLDPFAGSGTTLLVAKELGCSAVGIDLNPAYVALAQDRIAQEVLPFAAALDDTLPEEEAMPLPPEPEQLTFDLEVVA